MKYIVKLSSRLDESGTSIYTCDEAVNILMQNTIYSYISYKLIREEKISGYVIYEILLDIDNQENDTATVYSNLRASMLNNKTNDIQLTWFADIVQKDVGEYGLLAIPESRLSRRRNTRINYCGMDSDADNSDDYTYIDSSCLSKTNREIAYPCSMSQDLRNAVIERNKEFYQVEIAEAIEEYNYITNEKLDPNNYCVCENNTPNCQQLRCIIPEESVDIDHNPPLSKRFNETDYALSVEDRKKSFCDINRLFVMHLSCNRSKGGERYDTEKIARIIRKEYGGN